MLGLLLLAATLASGGSQGINLTIEGDVTQVDPARSLFLTVTLTSPKERQVALPDLRDRVVGFSLAEDFDEDPTTDKEGRIIKRANWRLVPEACAKVYKLKPFAVEDFIVGPVYFTAPAPREPVTGAMEADPKKVMPPLSWKLLGCIALVVLTVAGVLYGLFLLLGYLARRIKEHRMSPIERAWVELDRLLKKGLPGRGRYKDFYVELTLVVRRYIQRKYGINAPHMTTDEFLSSVPRAALGSGTHQASLSTFLTSADLIKFAGVEATPEMADEATESARQYLKGDSAE